MHAADWAFLCVFSIHKQIWITEYTNNNSGLAINITRLMRFEHTMSVKRTLAHPDLFARLILYCDFLHAHREQRRRYQRTVQLLSARRMYKVLYKIKLPVCHPWVIVVPRAHREINRLSCSGTENSFLRPARTADEERELIWDLESSLVTPLLMHREVIVLYMVFAMAALSHQFIGLRASCRIHFSLGSLTLNSDFICSSRKGFHFKRVHCKTLLLFHAIANWRNTIFPQGVFVELSIS